MKLEVSSNGPFGGKIRVPSTKIETQAAIICSILSRGNSIIRNLSDCDDVTALFFASTTMGAKLVETDDQLYVTGMKSIPNKVLLNCFDSLSTIKLFLAIFTMLGIEGNLITSETSIDEVLNKREIEFSTCSIKGNHVKTMSASSRRKFVDNRFVLDENFGADFATGLLLSLPLLKNDSEILFTYETNFKNELDITSSIMKKFGVFTQKMPNGYKIFGGQSYSETEILLESSYILSNYFGVGAALNGDLIIENLIDHSINKDREIISLLEKFGIVVYKGSNEIRVFCGDIKPCIIDMSEFSSSIPIFVILSIFSDGRTMISGFKKEEIPELLIFLSQLRKLGAFVQLIDDNIVIEGSSNFRFNGGELDANEIPEWFMSFLIAAIRSKKTFLIDGVDLSLPINRRFLNDYSFLGGKVRIL